MEFEKGKAGVVVPFKDKVSAIINTYGRHASGPFPKFLAAFAKHKAAPPRVAAAV
jgi:hypothetical protein